MAKETKDGQGRFVVQYRLKTEKWQEDIINKQMNIGCRIYNLLKEKEDKKLKEMLKTKQYKKLIELKKDFNQKIEDCNSSKEEKKLIAQRKKEVYIPLNDLYKKHGFTQYDFYFDVKKYSKLFNYNANVSRKVADRLWASYEKLFFGNGKKTKFKSKHDFNTISGADNKTGIRIIDNNCVVSLKSKKRNKIQIPLVFKEKDIYKKDSLENCRVVFSTLKREMRKGKWHYYTQITFEGTPPKCADNKKHPLGKGKVGIDIGVSTIAVSSENNGTLLEELADRVEKISEDIKIIERKMDRSRRTMNPNNFNSDGTIKKQGNKKVIWNKSNHYIKLRNLRKEFYRKQTAIRKYQHECLANKIISMGDTFLIEKMSFSNLSKRTEDINELNNKNSKRQFGRSIGQRAPALLISIIERKLKYRNISLSKINTYKIKASQFNHVDQSYKKASLNLRWKNIGQHKVQRDLYSAFLIMNIEEKTVNKNTSETINVESCNKNFQQFLINHENTIEYLRNLNIQNNKSILSCIGI